MEETWIQLNQEASKKQQRTYIDPQSGYRVFSTYGLLQRKDCCGCGCRHCPFGHREVSAEYRRKIHQNPWIEGDTSKGETFDVVSWSGGKDSYLALRTLQKESQRPILLMTTFDGITKKVAHQEVTLSMIQQQANALKLPILLIPLYLHYPYMTRIEQGLALLSQTYKIRRLVFGDLHLEYIRTWREEQLKTLMKEYDFTLHFPLWNMDYNDLMIELSSAKVRCTISAITDESCKNILQIGDVFDDVLIQKIPQTADKFGENGEFHTYVSFE